MRHRRTLRRHRLFLLHLRHRLEPIRRVQRKGQQLDLALTRRRVHRLRQRPPPRAVYVRLFAARTVLRMAVADAAAATPVKPSAIMPPASLDPANIYSAWDPPTGLSAYDFGFGAAFLDYDNDGYQDLYWLGALISRGLCCAATEPAASRT